MRLLHLTVELEHRRQFREFLFHHFAHFGLVIAAFAYKLLYQLLDGVFDGRVTHGTIIFDFGQFSSRFDGLI